MKLRNEQISLPSYVTPKSSFTLTRATKVDVLELMRLAIRGQKRTQSHSEEIVVIALRNSCTTLDLNSLVKIQEITKKSNDTKTKLLLT